jgi:hypothetical protein
VFLEVTAASVLKVLGLSKKFYKIWGCPKGTPSIPF